MSDGEQIIPDQFPLASQNKFILNFNWRFSMKIFIVCSKYIYEKIPPIKESLEKSGHIVTTPNSFHDPFKEEEMKKVGAEEHKEWKSGMLRLQKQKVLDNDAVLVLNMEKNGMPNYIGGATFIEIYQAFDSGKKIFFYNPLPENFLTDELLAMDPVVINCDLDLIQ